MTTRSILAVALLTIAAAIYLPRPATAQQPTYLILGGPTVETSPRPRPHHAANPGVGVSVTAPTYTYGWFGATPHRHWYRHFGYYRNYTQWTRR